VRGGEEGEGCLFALSRGVEASAEEGGGVGGVEEGGVV
jgi:hypothetical protein